VREGGRSSVRLLLAALTAGLALALAAEGATAHAGHGPETVRPRVGPPLLTHGPDTRQEMSGPRVAGRASGGIGFGRGSAQRAPVCADSHALQAIYARPSGTRSRFKRTAREIRAAIRRMDAVLNSESLASGGPTADYRVHCDGDGAVSVGRFVSPDSGFAEIVSAARAAGYGSLGTDYLIFFDGAEGNVCGTASLVDDERAVMSNAANWGGGFGVVYAGCWTNETPMHETAHIMGAVQYGAPHSTGTGGHCAQESDVMCYSPDGGDRNQFATNDCPGAQRFDCGFDDYFDAAPEPGEYLANHWNLGSPLNRFIAFNAAPPQETPLGAISSLLGSGRSRASSAEIAAAPGQWRLFDLQVNGLSRALTVTLRGAPLGVELYLRSRKAPSEGSYACRDVVRRGAAVCRVDRPRGGHWIAGVLNRGAGAGTPFGISAKLQRG
jgi:hypothetical protein